MSIADVALGELERVRDDLDKLTDRRDELIRELARESIPRQRIADAAGVTRQHTYNIAPGGTR